MFEKKSLMFYYCTTPLHMGAGTAVGAIDNPIQREVHTNHPMIAGSGVKGAIRHHVTRQWAGKNENKIVPLFGAESSSGDLTAGALSFTDANLVAFPVRSMKNTFVYVTSPNALARLKRTAQRAEIKADWPIPQIKDGKALAASDSSIFNSKLCVEAYEFEAVVDNGVQSIAAWLSEKCLADDDCNGFFKEKVKADLFVVGNDFYDYFVKQATVVEPHVRIDDATGTAMDGALFYTENLPPESILVGMVLASIERRKGEGRMTAEKCLEEALWAENGISGQMIQMGGDATTGRGLVLVNAVKGD